MKSPVFKSYLNLFLATGSLYLADQILLFLVPLILYSITRDVSLSAWVYALEWAVRVGSGLISHQFVTRIGAARTVMGTEICRAALVLALLAYLIVPEFASIGIFIVPALGLLFAFLNSIATVSIGIFVAQTVPSNDYARVDSYLGALDQISMIAGPSVAGILWEIAPKPILAGVSFGLLILATALFFNLSEHGQLKGESSQAGEPSKSLTQMRLAHDRVWRQDPVLARCLISAIFVNGLIGCAEALGPYALTERIGHSGVWLGAMNSVSGLTGAVLLTRASNWIQRYGAIPVWKASHLIISCAAFGLSLAFHPAFWVGSFAMLIGGALVGGVSYRSYRMSVVEPGELPAVISYMWSVGQLGSVFSALLAGLLAKVIDPFHAFVVIGGTFTLWWIRSFLSIGGLSTISTRLRNLVPAQQTITHKFDAAA